jgi:hypothetical protein
MSNIGGQLNLVVACVIFLITVGIFVVDKSKLLKDNPFLKHALFFWLGQWFCLIVLWLIQTFGSGSYKIWLLAIIDLQSMFAIAFSVAFLMGKEYRWQTAISKLGLLYLVLFLFDVGVGLYVHQMNYPTNPTYYWTAPSQILSIVAYSSLGLVFFLRYGLNAAPLVIACVFYAALQRPVYGAIFLDPASASQNTLLALAAGKTLVGSTFFSLFFEPARNYECIRPISDVHRLISYRQEALRGFGTLVAVSLGVLLLVLLRRAISPEDIWSGVGTTGMYLLGLAAPIVMARFIQFVYRFFHPLDRPEAGNAAD